MKKILACNLKKDEHFLLKTQISPEVCDTIPENMKFLTYTVYPHIPSSNTNGIYKILPDGRLKSILSNKRQAIYMSRTVIFSYSLATYLLKN